MKIIISILFSILTLGLFAQKYQRTASEIVHQPEKKAGIYRISGTYLKTAVVNMSFGESDILSIMDKEKLQKADIIQIDLVYTNFPKGEDISALNKQRIIKIGKIRPDLITNRSIKWQLVRQMYCHNESQAKLLFHGAVIYYQPKQTKELSSVEQSEYKELPKNDKVKITKKSLKQFSNDPVIIKAMERNKWVNPTIVADVTGSMYPYMKQMAYWFLLKMNKKQESNFIFFNDGGDKPTHLKIVGATGGIYSESSTKYCVFRETLIEAVSHGCGGDTPENDVEAILKAQKEYPKAKGIILIADNHSDMRDYELITKIKKPVHILLCGTKYGINVEYLNLARETGGTVHTLKRDLTNLIEKSEGDTFTIMGKEYIIRDGEIVEKAPNNRDYTKM